MKTINEHLKSHETVPNAVISFCRSSATGDIVDGDLHKNMIEQQNTSTGTGKYNTQCVACHFESVMKWLDPVIMAII